MEELLQAGKTKGRDYDNGLFHFFKKKGLRRVLKTPGATSPPCLYLSLLQSLCEAIFRHTLRLSSELKRGIPKHSSRGTHSSSEDGAEKTGKVATLESPFWVFFKPVVVDIKSFPTLRLCFALPVIVFCHELEGLRAAVGVDAAA